MAIITQKKKKSAYIIKTVIMFDKYKKRIASLCLMSALLISFSACSDDDEEIDNGWHIEGNTTVTVKPERTKLLRNPFNGWVMYSGLGDGLDDRFWEIYDNFDSTIGKVKVSDYSTTLFIRGAWSDFNPEEGKYAWNDDINTKAAQRFKMLVNGAKERKMKLAFSFVVDSRDKAYDFTPRYVRDAVGDAGGYLTQVGSSDNYVWSPYPDNAIFQQFYERFVRDLAEKYDDPDVTEFISGTGLGKWGESHTVWYSTNDDTPKTAVFEWVTDVYSKAFKKVPVIINYHRWIFSRQTWDGSKYAADSESLINSAINKGYSLRHDAFGMKTYYTTWERSFANKKKFIRPIIGEGGWVKNSHGSSIKGDGYETYADVRVGEFSDGKNACVNMMDFRYSKDIKNGETYSWFNDAFNLVQQFIAEGGYRLYPDRLSLPKDVKNGSSIAITHRWINLGWGYCPTNLPQWKNRYKIAFALLDKNSLTPKYVFVDRQSELSTFIKGSAKKLSFKQDISNVAVGNYIWAIGIVDTTKDNNQIGIQISARENVTPEGWVTLTDVSVQ